MSDQPKLLFGNDAMSMLIDVYLDGVMTGVASVSATFGLSDLDAAELAKSLSRAMDSDPLAIDMVRTQITERLSGVDTGMHALHIADPGERA